MLLDNIIVSLWWLNWSGRTSAVVAFFYARYSMSVMVKSHSFNPGNRWVQEIFIRNRWSQYLFSIFVCKQIHIIFDSFYIAFNYAIHSDDWFCYFSKRKIVSDSNRPIIGLETVNPFNPAAGCKVKQYYYIVFQLRK